MTPRLHSVPPPAPEKAPREGLHDYESQTRQASAATDWAALHVAADRRKPFAWLGVKQRGWR